MRGNHRVAYNFPCRGTWGRRRPSLYTQNEDSERGIAELRIISLVEAHGDGDVLPFIRRMRILKRGIARLRIISLFEAHGDGDAPSLYTQNNNFKEGNR